MKTLASLIKDFDFEYEIIQGNPEKTDITAVVYDSRKAVSGSVFICIPGTVSDGHKYISQVLEAGAKALVVTHKTDDVIPDDVTVIRVENARRALAFMSAAWFDYPSRKLTTIGVTGTKGKTTTTYMIRDIIQSSGISCGLIGTIEIITGAESVHSEHTTPESYVVQEYFAKMVDTGCKAVVMEVSSQALKMDRVAGISFDYGIFTNLEKDHIGDAEHPDMADYIYCKSLLFKMSRVGIFNADADYLDEIFTGNTCEEVYFYGMKHDADFKAENAKGVRVGAVLGVEYDLKISEKIKCSDREVHVSVDIPGDFTVYNSLSAIALCVCMGIDKEDYLNALKKVQVKGRMEILDTPGEYVLMTDYAHNAMSLNALLENLRPHTEGRLICCFGCGGNRDRNRRFEMGEVSSRLADLSVVTSDNPRFEEPSAIIDDILVGIKKADGEYVTIPDRKEAIRYCMKIGKKGDVIVLAGKGHEDYQEIKGVKYPMDERVMVADIIKEENWK